MKYPLCLIFLFALLLSMEGNEFVIRYQSLSAGKVYYVETKSGECVGKILRNSHVDFKLSKERCGGKRAKIEMDREGIGSYALLDLEDSLLTEGVAKKSKYQATVTFTKPNGTHIGYFSAQILNSSPTKYYVFSTTNQLIAEGYMNWLSNHFVLTHPDNPRHLIATFSRPMFKLFNDNWHFQIHEEGVVDFSILSIIGAFQTACDLKFEQLLTSHPNCSEPAELSD